MKKDSCGNNGIEGENREVLLVLMALAYTKNVAV